MAQSIERQKSIRLDVDASLLHWAMNRSGKYAEELSKKKQLNDLGKWLAGTKKPTLVQLENFAKATYTPFGYLLLSEPPQERTSQIPHFRTTNRDDPPRRSINLKDTIQIIEQRQEWVRDYLIEIGAEPLRFVGANSISDDPVDVSNSIRETLELDSDWTAQHSDWGKAQKYLHKRLCSIRGT